MHPRNSIFINVTRRTTYPRSGLFKSVRSVSIYTLTIAKILFGIYLLVFSMSLLAIPRDQLCETCVVSLAEMDEIDDSATQWLFSFQHGEHQVNEWKNDLSEINMCDFVTNAYGGPEVVRHCEFTIKQNQYWSKTKQKYVLWEEPVWHWELWRANSQGSWTHWKSAYANALYREQCLMPYPNMAIIEGVQSCYRDKPLCYYPYYQVSEQCLAYCPSYAPDLDYITGKCIEQIESDKQCRDNNIKITSGELSLNHINLVNNFIPKYNGGGPLPLTFNLSYFDKGAPESDPLFGFNERLNLHNSFGLSLDNFKEYKQPRGYRGIRDISYNVPIILERKGDDVDLSKRPGAKQWRHNYESFLVLAKDLSSISILSSIHNPLVFKNIDGHYKSKNGEIINKVGNYWVYIKSPTYSEYYSESGFILKQEMNSAIYISYEYDKSGRLLKAKHSLNGEINFDYNSSNELSLVTLPNQRRISYEYDLIGNLIMISENNELPITFSYDSPAHPHRITSVTVNQVPILSITYDLLGRVTSLKEGANSGETTLEYSRESTKKVNKLGKITTYDFLLHNGIKRLTSITGEPTSTCAESNVSYEYDAQGNRILKTQNGIKTRYRYDTTGLEIERVEAEGTPEQRVIKTEWNTQLRKPSKVIYPDRVELFQYNRTGMLVLKKIL